MLLNKRYHKLLSVAAFMLLLSANAVYGQCPDPSTVIITKIDEQCFGAKDGVIIFKFTDGIFPSTFDYRVSVWNYEKGTNGGFIYADDNLPFQNEIPSPIITQDSLILTGMFPGDFVLVLDDGDCNDVVYGENFTGGFKKGIQISAAKEVFLALNTVNTEDNTRCTAPFDGKVDATGVASGGSGSFSYSLDGTTYQASPVFEALEANTYTLYVKDNNADNPYANAPNCIQEINDIVVNDNLSPPTVDLFASPSEVCNNTDVVLNGNPSGGTEPYTHSWTGDVAALDDATIATPTFNSSTNGTYNLTYTLTDAKGCSATESITITVNAGPTSAELSGTDTICNGSSANLIVTITDGTGPYSLEIDNVGIINSYNSGDAIPVNPTATTTYTLVGNVADAKGCTVVGSGSATITVTNNPNTALTVDTQDTEVCSGESTFITIQNSEVGINYQLRNDGDDSVIGSVVTGDGNTISLPTGALTNETTFNVLASSSTCPPAELATLATITVNNATSVSFSGLNSSYCTTDGPVTLNSSDVGTFGGPGVTDNGDGTATFDPAAAGEAMHEITFQGTCAVDKQTVTVEICPDVNFTADKTTVCEGEPVTFQSTGTAGTTYSWTFGTGSTQQTSTEVEPTVTFSGAGSYTVTLEVDGNPVTKADYITVDAPPTAEAGPSATVCVDSHTLQANEPSTGETGTWSAKVPGPTFDDVNNHAANVSSLNSGPNILYWTVTGTCEVIDSVEITSQGAASVNAGEDQTICTDQATLSAAPLASGETGSWQVVEGSGSFVDSSNPQTTVNGLSLDKNVFLWTVTGVCGDISDAVEIIRLETSPDATFTYNQDKYCTSEGSVLPVFTTGRAGVFSAVPTPSSSATLFIDAETGEIDLTGSTPATYIVTNYISGQNVCNDASHTFEIQVIAQATAALDYGGATSFCQSDPNPTPTFSPAGGTFEYTATGGGTLDLGSDGTINLSASDADTYEIRYSSNGLCSDIASVTVEITASADATFNYASSAYCVGDGIVTPDTPPTTPGAFSITPIAPTDPAAVLIIDATDGSIDLDNSDPGSYRITYTTNDPSGCNDNETFDVTLSTAVASAGDDDTSCSLTYELKGNVPTSGTGRWTVVAGDPANINFDNFNRPNATATAQVAGPYAFEWKVTSGSCEAADTVEINYRGPFAFIGGITATSACGASDGGVTRYIKLEPGEDSSRYTFTWNGSGDITYQQTSLGSDNYGFLNAANLSAGVYEIHVLDNKTLVCDTLFTVTVPSEGLKIGGKNSGQDVIVSSEANVCTGDAEGKVTVATSLDEFFDITYYDRQGNLIEQHLNVDMTAPGEQKDSLDNLTSGRYNIEIEISGSGCLSGYSEDVKEPEEIDIYLNKIIPASCPGEDDGSIDITVSGGTTPYAYSWKEVSNSALGITDEDPTGLAAGDYFVEITYSGSCTVTSQTFTVTEPTATAGPVASNPNLNTITCNSFQAKWNSTGAASYVLDVSRDDTFTDLVLDNESIPGTETTYLVNSLEANTTYWYRIRALDGCATSNSNVISVQTNSTAAPRVEVATNPSCDAFTANWTAVADAARYNIVVASDNAFTNIIKDETTADATQTNYRVENVDGGETYYYRVRVETSCGWSDFSDSEEVTTQGITGNVTLQPTTTTCESATIQWTAITGVSNYTIEVSDASDFNTIFKTQSAVNEEEKTVSGLSSGTQYFFRIIASLGCDSDTVAGDFTTDQAPDMPQNVVGEEGCNGFMVTWDEVSNATEYQVRVTDASDVLIDEYTVTTNAFSINTLAEDTEYKFQVQAINACGTSPYTTAQSVRTRTEDQCGCGFDKAEFVLNAVDVNCISDTDGALFVDVLSSSTTMTRFEYQFYPASSPEDSTAWVDGLNNGIREWRKGDLPPGDYVVRIRDKFAQEECDKILPLVATIKAKNDLTTTAQPETCEVLGGIIVEIPETCANSAFYRVRIVGPTGDVETQIDGNQIAATELASGAYQVIVEDDLNGTEYSNESVFVPNNCSTEPSAECNFTDKTALAETTLADCETGNGTVRLFVLGGETETYTFQVRDASGEVTFDTQTAQGEATFEELPQGRYSFLVVDETGGRCQDIFTIARKTVAFATDYPQVSFPVCDDPNQSARITVRIDTANSLAAAPYDVALLLAGDTVQTTTLNPGTLEFTFRDVAIGFTYDVAIKPRAQETCSNLQPVDVTNTGTVVGFLYTADNITCFGDGTKISVDQIVAAPDRPFTLNLYQNGVLYEENVLTNDDDFVYQNLEAGEYQLEIIQDQIVCDDTVAREKRSETFEITGPRNAFAYSVNSLIEVTVAYPYGTIEIDSIARFNAPYKIRIAAGSDPDTAWVEIVNDNPAARPYRYTYPDMPIGDYLIEVRDGFGCTIDTLVQIRYTTDLFVPNIFTPNDDGVNDTFEIVNLDIYGEDEGVRLRIVNRLGITVFSSDNYTNAEAWDGEENAEGIYFYYLTLSDGSQHTGWVELFRGKTP